MSSERAAAAALVDWINSCPIDSKISSLSDLSDGMVIAKVLLDIDPYYFRTSGGTESTASGPDSHWVLRFHRLKRLHKDLVRYYTEALGHRLPSGPPNLTAIAKDGNVEASIKLVRIIVAAAVHSDRREAYIKNIQALSPSSQTEIMGVITQMMELDEAEDMESEEHQAEAGNDEDHFRLEEEMARLVADKETVEAENRSLKIRFKALQNEYDDNQSALSNLQDRISSGKIDKNYANRTDPMMRSQLDQLQSDVQKLEDIIAEKEAIITSQEGKLSSLKRQVDDLLPKAEMGTKYKDDLDEASHQLDRLRKSQNVAEKYRKKLEGMGDLGRQVKTLEEQNAQMLQDLRAGEDNSKQVPGLRRMVEQYKKQIEKLETEYAEAIRAKHILETEKDMLREKAAGAESQKSKDMERIQVLEEKVRELESGVISKVSDEINGDLEAELTFSTKTKTDLKLQISRLENELAHLKEGGGVGADNVVLQHMLDDANRARIKLENDFLQANTEKLVLESQLAAIRSGATSEGSEVMLKLRQSLVDTEKQLSELKRKHSETVANLNNANRELVTAKSDLSLVDKDKLEALDELKATANVELGELQVVHAELESKAKDLELELDQKKGLLNKVLLEKDELSQRISDQKDQILEKEQATSDLKATIAAFEGSAEGRDAALEKRVAVLQKKLDDRRDKMIKTNQHIKKLNETIKELEEKLELTLRADADERLKLSEEKYDELKRKTDEEIKILERENAVLAVAYHDTSSRLQMNSVVLLRRSDAPNSWINKQRAAVNSSMKK